VGESEVPAEHVDALLTLGFPLVGQGGHGVHAGESDRSLLASQLRSGGTEAFGEEADLVATAGLVVFEVFLLAVVDDQRHSRAAGVDDSKSDLQYVGLGRAAAELFPRPLAGKQPNRCLAQASAAPIRRPSAVLTVASDSRPLPLRPGTTLPAARLNPPRSRGRAAGHQ
jgi:hypothetical protein